MRRTEFPCFRPIGTRWLDNDAYGHINNVAYYAYFDTVVNGYLMDATGVDIRKLPAIGVVAETSCRFLRSLSFPQSLVVGLAVEKLGERSIVYRLGVFAADDDDQTEAAALGRFVHVYVDTQTRKTVAIPEEIRNAVKSLVVSGGEEVS